MRVELTALEKMPGQKVLGFGIKQLDAQLVRGGNVAA
jgi:hypothetical protein